MVQPGTQNRYVFGNPEVDRYRLEFQTQLMEGYVREHTREFCGEGVGSILDLGCGDGQLSFVLKSVYPQARLVGIDKDEKAIAKAQAGAEAKGLTDCEFLAGDIQAALPDGQFSLIYLSLILVHLPDPRQVLERAVNRLAPGGHIWIKEMNPAMFEAEGAAAFVGGSYLRLMQMFAAAMASVGGNAMVAMRLPTWLAELGLVITHTEHEVYMVGGETDEGQAMLGNSLAGFFNARQYMVKAANVDEAELERLFSEVTAAWKRGDELRLPIGLDIVARKP